MRCSLCQHEVRARLLAWNGKKVLWSRVVECPEPYENVRNDLCAQIIKPEAVSGDVEHDSFRLPQYEGFASV